MDRWLIGGLRVVNIVLAVIFILGGVLLGGVQTGGNIFGVLFGGLGGIVLSVLSCGFIAVAVDSHRLLRDINDKLDRR